MSQRSLDKGRHAATGGVHVHEHVRARAVDAHALLPQFLRCAPCEVERVHRLQVWLVAAALDPRGEAELVEQLCELPRCGVDHLQVALLLLVEVVHPYECLRESVDGRQRGSQIVGGKRNEARKGGVGLLHEGADTNLSA